MFLSIFLLLILCYSVSLHRHLRHTGVKSLVSNMFNKVDRYSDLSSRCYFSGLSQSLLGYWSVYLLCIVLGFKFKSLFGVILLSAR